MPILTAKVGKNCDLFPDILEMYVHAGSRILDLTYGRGVFWQKADRSKYKVVTNDIKCPADYSYDLRDTGFSAGEFDVVILDPPYMHGGKTVKPSINQCYLNENGDHRSIVALYEAGLRESWRLLPPKGLVVVKCQDETESGKQQLTHVEVFQAAIEIGYKCLDLFVLVQSTIPAMRVSYQKSARKNHSYFMVFQRKGKV